MRESDIEKYLVARVKALGGEVRKVKWIGRRGAPDRIVMLPARGKCPTAAEVLRYRDEHCCRMEDAKRALDQRRAPLTVWVELKAPDVPPEAHQVREHERMRAAGQYVEVVDSFSRVDEVLA